MNKQELIEKYKDKYPILAMDLRSYGIFQELWKDIKQLDEPETGHAEEAPRYVKNILARLRELPLHDREVWLKSIMGEFEQDFSRAKWREGYEQGKVEGLIEREKVTIPQFVADFIREQKKLGHTLSYSIDACMSDRVAEWYWDNSELFARAWIDGYEVENEKRYLVKLKGAVSPYLNYDVVNDWWFLNKKHNGFTVRTHHTRKELEKAGFGEVFNSPLFEVEEVEG